MSRIISEYKKAFFIYNPSVKNLRFLTPPLTQGRLCVGFLDKPKKALRRNHFPSQGFLRSQALRSQARLKSFFSS